MRSARIVSQKEVPKALFLTEKASRMVLPMSAKVERVPRFTPERREAPAARKGVYSREWSVLGVEGSQHGRR